MCILSRELTRIICAGLFITLPAQVGAQPGVRVIALTGQSAPDGNGTFATFGQPSLNQSGEVAFAARLSGTANEFVDDEGVFLGSGRSPLTQIARAGTAAPDGNGIFQRFEDPLVNGAGQVAFLGFLDETNQGGSDNGGIFRSDGSLRLMQITRELDPAPDGNGVFASFDGLAMNDAGTLSFRGFLLGTASGTSDDQGVFSAEGLGKPTQFARESELAPDGVTYFSTFSAPALNDSGQMAFYAGLRSSPAGGPLVNGSILVSDPDTGLTRVVGKNDPAPDGHGTFLSFGAVALNDVGQVAFAADVLNPMTFLGEDAILRGDGPANLLQIVRRGDAAPDGNGSFDEVFRLDLNAAGQVAFEADLIGTSEPGRDTGGLFRGDGHSGILQIVRHGDVAPDGNGRFASLPSLSLNDHGAVAFEAHLWESAGGAADNRGLFYYDNQMGLLQVARTGDPLLGSTITALGFNGSGRRMKHTRGGPNNLGQIAFTFNLADGRQGVAVWSAPIPEPTSLHLILAGLAAVAAGVSVRR